MQYVLPQIAAISIGSNCGAFNASQGASATGFVLLGGEKGRLFFHWPPPFLTDMSRLETCQSEQNACPIIGLTSFLIDTCLDLTIMWTAISAVRAESNAR